MSMRELMGVPRGERKGVRAVDQAQQNPATQTGILGYNTRLNMKRCVTRFDGRELFVPASGQPENIIGHV